MNAHPPPPAGRTLAAPCHRRRTHHALAAGCAALLLAALAPLPAPTAAEPAARTGAPSAKAKTAKPKPAADSAQSKSQSRSKSKSAKAKPAAEPVKPKTTQANKRQPRKTSVGQAANPLPLAAMAMVPGPAQAESAARAASFEAGPGVLGVSLRTARQQQIKEYVTEPVAMVALAFDDLRFGPVNKGDHVEINLANRVQFEAKGDKVAPKSRRVLDVIARILADNPATRIQVLVHTDDGDAATNLRQSQKGAAAVAQYLMSKGLAGDRITAIGRGSEAPLSDKRTHRFRNKRVELRVEPLTPPAVPQQTGGGTSAGAASIGAIPGGIPAPSPTATMPIPAAEAPSLTPPPTAIPAGTPPSPGTP